MRKTTFRLTAAFAVALAIGLVTGPAGGASADSCTGLSGYHYSATLTGYGIDCASATADLQSRLDASIAGECQDDFGYYWEDGIASTTLVITSTCSCHGCCDYRVSGYLQYQCRVCAPILDPDEPEF